MRVKPELLAHFRVRRGDDGSRRLSDRFARASAINGSRCANALWTAALLLCVAIRPGFCGASVSFAWQVSDLGAPIGRLQYPNGAEVSSDGALVYLADTGNSRVVVLTSSGAPVLQFGSYGSGTGQFNLPADVAVDAAGNIFVADTMNHRVQKFSSSGSFLFQIGGYGSGPGQLISPRGVAVDRASNTLYVVDTLNHRVARYSSQTGAYLGSWGSFGTASGQFRFPQDAAVDQAGNIYITDFVNHRVQKLSNSGTVLAVWGEFGSQPGQFQFPWGIAVGRNIYISDMSNHRIQAFTSSGTFVSTYGSYAAGGSAGSGLDHPKGLGVFSAPSAIDRLYLAQPGAHAANAYDVSTGPGSLSEPTAVAHHRTNALDRNGEEPQHPQSATAGAPAATLWAVNTTGGPAGSFQYLSGVEVSSDGTLVYGADTGNSRVVVLTSSGAPVLQFGSYGSGTGQFNLPSDVAVDAAGNIFVSDTMNHRVQKFSSSGSFLFQVGGYGSGPGQLNTPHGIALDRTSNTLYVVDTLNHRVARYSSQTGANLGSWGSFGTASGQFRFPHDAAVDQAGNVYITDFVNHRVQKLSNIGTVLAVWGEFGSEPGQLRDPWGIAVGRNVYVSDTSNHRIQIFTPTGTFVSTYGSYAAGISSGYYFDTSKAVAVFSGTTGNDRLYLADAGANTIYAYLVGSDSIPALSVTGVVILALVLILAGFTLMKSQWRTGRAA